MAKAKTERITVKTGTFRVSYPHVFVPQKNTMDPTAEAKYELTMLFDAKDPFIETLKFAAKKAVAEKWGADPSKWPTRQAKSDATGALLTNPDGTPKLVSALKMPWRDGMEKPDQPGYGAGIIFVKATSKMKPGVVSLEIGPDGKFAPIIQPAEFYGGCYAHATINVYAYDTKGNKGVGVSLNNIQKLKDGEQFGGRSAPEDDFDAIKPGGAVAAGAPAAGAASTAPNPFE